MFSTLEKRTPHLRCFKTKTHLSVLQAQLEVMLEKWKAEKEQDSTCRTTEELNNVTFGTFIYFCSAFGADCQVLYRSVEMYKRLQKNNQTEDMGSRYLRICSCIQLALKLHSCTDYFALTNHKIKRVLCQNLGGQFPIGLQDIMNSELRVLKSLKFKLYRIEVLDFVEQLWSLVKTCNRLAAAEAYHFCMLFLELESYTAHNHVYLSSNNEVVLKSYELNFPLRAASIVHCAFSLVEPNASRLKELTELISVPEADLPILAAAIMKALY